MPNHKTLRIVNAHLFPLAAARLFNGPQGQVIVKPWLDCPLHGAESRARTRILAVILEKVREIEKDRMQVVANRAEKDEKGVVKVDAGGNPTFASPEESQAAVKEVNDLLGAEAAFDTSENAADWLLVRKVLANLTRDLNAEEGAIYEAVMEALENAFGK